MGEYFLGWRRKTGLATLLLACLFMAVWIRGMVGVTDKVVIPGERSFSVVWLCNFRISPTLGIGWTRYANTDVKQSWPKSFNWSSSRMPSDDVIKNTQLRDAKYRASEEWVVNQNWKHEFQGFVFGGSRHMTEIAAPYWFVVITLTLISAELLLRKSGKRPSPAQTAPSN